MPSASCSTSSSRCSSPPIESQQHTFAAAVLHAYRNLIDAAPDPIARLLCAHMSEVQGLLDEIPRSHSYNGLGESWTQRPGTAEGARGNQPPISPISVETVGVQPSRHPVPETGEGHGSAVLVDQTESSDQSASTRRPGRGGGREQRYSVVALRALGSRAHLGRWIRDACTRPVGCGQDHQCAFDEHGLAANVQIG